MPSSRSRRRCRSVTSNGSAGRLARGPRQSRRQRDRRRRVDRARPGARRGRTSVVLIGDLAFVHDSNALSPSPARDVDLRIVVVDNDGGGIFSFLPAGHHARRPIGSSSCSAPRSASTCSRSPRPTASRPSTARPRPSWRPNSARPGPWVCRVPSDRRHNVEVHDASTPPSPPRSTRRGSPARSRADDRAEHRLELRLGLGEFGQRLDCRRRCRRPRRAGPIAGRRTARRSGSPPPTCRCRRRRPSRRRRRSDPVRTPRPARSVRSPAARGMRRRAPVSGTGRATSSTTDGPGCDSIPSIRVPRCCTLATVTIEGSGSQSR